MTNYTELEKNILALCIAFLLPSFIIALNTDFPFPSCLFIVIAVISASEIFFIITFREIVDDQPRNIDESNIDCDLFTIGFSKLLSILAACLILGLAAALIAFLVMLFDELYPLIISMSALFPLVLLSLVTFMTLVLINKILIHKIYRIR